MRRLGHDCRPAAVSGFHGEGCMLNAGAEQEEAAALHPGFPQLIGCPRAILLSFCSFMICFGVIFLLTNVSDVYWRYRLGARHCLGCWG